MIRVIGAGFSGLTLAHYLKKRGLAVEVWSRDAEPGGLIHTRQTSHGLVETAANALLRDDNVSELFDDLGLSEAATLPERRRRYIYWGRPRRWPLTFATSLHLPALLWRRPRTGESVAEFGRRAVNQEFVDRLLAPALQGIYAGDPEQLSATLILQNRRRGGPSVAPVRGMGELIGALSRSVPLRQGTPARSGDPTVVCTSAWDAAELVDEPLARELRRCESLPLVTATAFFPRARDLSGFGCLFPASQGFRALGVLFNTSIFAGRGEARSETWIFGGALARDVIHWSDEQLREYLIEDRHRLSGETRRPEALNITRWPRAIPHYTLEWEARLRTLKVPRPLFLHGNYLGSLGLSSILERSRRLAAELESLYAG